MYKKDISDIDKPFLEWHAFLHDIQSFHDKHADIIEEATGEKVDIGAMAHKLFIHLCVDYHFATRGEDANIANYDLTYKLAEA
jgi:hypothetical protein